MKMNCDGSSKTDTAIREGSQGWKFPVHDCLKTSPELNLKAYKCKSLVWMP